MLTHELLIKCEDGFEGTAKEVCKHLKLPSAKKVTEAVVKCIRLKGHSFITVGVYKYYRKYKIYDLKGKLVDEGLAIDLAERYYCDKNCFSTYARKGQLLQGMYKVEKAEMIRVLKRY